MIGTLDPKQKAKWQDWVATLTHAYNCTQCESMGFSPYYLMFSRVPRLPIDIGIWSNLTTVDGEKSTELC